ncbi:MAG: oligosaccharide flippase family protein [Tissierellales bacterium]|nr:oligosaccharide flippase family protein [Tissierellales bacterium]MBN2828266.1 oligosaccharide flippase family protein [Tissierellales bacterium]
MLLPLITYPYLIRVLGKETYGLVVFAQAIIAYLVIFISFGFNLSATRQISIHRNNRAKTEEIVSSIITLKGILFFISILILICLILVVPQIKENWLLYTLSMYLCLYEFVFPIWYFQGIEQMKYITVLNLISRGSFVILIFLLIKSPADYLWVPALNGIGSIFSCFLALLIIFRLHKIKFRLQTQNKLIHYLKESIPFFISNISGQVYVKANKVLIGAFLGMTEVAYYDLAEKVVTVLKIPQGLLGQVIYPKISRDKDKKFLRKIFRFSFVFNTLLFSIVVIYAKKIVLILGGTNMGIEAVYVLQILLITIPIIAINSYYVIQLLLPFGFQKEYMRISIYSVLLYGFLFGILIITNQTQIYLITSLTVVVELFVNIQAYYLCRKNKLLS